MRHWRGSRLTILAGLALLSTVASGIAVSQLPLLAGAERFLEDVRTVTITSPSDQHADIVILSITEDTLAALPYRSPVDRSFLAALLDRLHEVGVAAIGLDILLDQPTESAKDRLLHETMRRVNPPLVVAWAEPQDGLTTRQFSALETFTAGLIKGRANLLTDPRDGAVRWIFPGKDSESEWIPGFAAAIQHSIVGQAVDTGTLASPRELVYRKAPDNQTSPFRTFQAHTAHLLPKEWLRDKIVLIGMDSPHQDRHRTPAANVLGASEGELPGIVIHALSLAQLLDNENVRRLEPSVTWLLLGFFALIGLALAVLDLPTWVRATAGAAIAVIAWLGGFVLYAKVQLLVPLVAPTMALILTAGLGLAITGREARKERAFIRGAFSRYVAPTVVTHLLENPERLTLGGERREITALFTDLESFTELVEKYPPEIVVPVLNRYIDGLCQIAVNCEGTVDKVIGDAVVVLFGAPLQQADHAERAVQCALKMRSFANAFAREQRAADLPAFGATRIGVNTGTATVGNFGGDTFFDYTAHGDCINTASRLEGANKYTGTRILVAGSTAAAYPQMRCRPVAELVVKGKSDAVAVVEPIDDVFPADHLETYLTAYDAMRAGNAEAVQMFRTLAANYPSDMVVAKHAERLAEGKLGCRIELEGK